jgi:hypothetical protein
MHRAGPHWGESSLHYKRRRINSRQKSRSACCAVYNRDARSTDKHTVHMIEYVAAYVRSFAMLNEGAFSGSRAAPNLGPPAHAPLTTLAAAPGARSCARSSLLTTMPRPPRRARRPSRRGPAASRPPGAPRGRRGTPPAPAPARASRSRQSGAQGRPSAAGFWRRWRRRRRRGRGSRGKSGRRGGPLGWFIEGGRGGG